MIENRFAKILADKKLDKRDIVKMTGIDNHAIKKLYDGTTSSIRFDTLDKLCYALECNTSDILRYKENP